MNAETARRTLAAAVIVAAVVLSLLLLWSAATVFLLAFGATLLALFFSSAAEWLGHKTRLPYWANAVLVLVAAAALVGAAIWLRAPQIVSEVDKLRQDLPQALKQLHSTVQQNALGRQVLRQLPDPGALIQGGENAMATATNVFSTAFAAFGHIIFVLFVFLFILFEPGVYRRGIEVLVPPARRRRASEVLDNVSSTLVWWLVARAAAMTAVSVLTTVGLMLLDVPLALTLGLIAGLLDFVPNFGPIIAAFPAVLLAAAQGPDTAVYVMLLYAAIQLLEGNVLTPLAQRKAIDMPPVLVILSQFALGTVFGTLGFVFATPLVAVVLVLVRMLYVQEPEPAAGAD